MKIKLLCLILVVCLLCGCTTTPPVDRVYLPEFEPIIPTRPTLDPIPAVSIIPIEVNVNLVRLFSYVEQLEAYGEGWRNYYNSLKNSGLIGVAL